MNHIKQLTEKQISTLLDTEVPSTSDLPETSEDKTFRKASVLIPFVKEDDQWHIVFIKRADSPKDRHSGQVAFVGGKHEETDSSDIETALRETEEEIGIKPNDVEVLGQLGTHYSISEFQITPVVATLSWPYALNLDPAEVKRVFTIPLVWLADDSNYRIEQRKMPDSDQETPVVYFKEYDGELLWGATAKMMLSLLKQIKD